MADPSRRDLIVLIGGRIAGGVRQDARGRLRFTYDDDWRRDSSHTPLSVSMPLSTPTHDDEVVRPFLWGLLPDNEQVLERWGRANGVSAGNPFALLGAVGEDCAGAVQLAMPDRVDALLKNEGHIRWLDDADVAARLRQLRADPTAWHAAGTGQFSLAGAQAKTALYYDHEAMRWGVPSGATPTTHILKPAVTGFDAHDLNEHLCLATARRLGLAAARSHVATFEEERTIVVERYDRLRVGDTIVRVHQEDLCQALGMPPALKYQNEGGPSPERIAGLLRTAVRPQQPAEASVATFADALALNWLLAGTDAHAKNYSLLLSGEQVRLAPLYDVASALPYDNMQMPKLALAMRIGGDYRLQRISGRHWRRLAEDLRLDADVVLGRAASLAEELPEQMALAAADDDVRALGSSLPQRLVDRVAGWAKRCRRELD